MREGIHRAWRCGSALAAVVVALGFAAKVDASPQRRGRIYIPPRPANVDSTPMIDGLNKALKALGATDRDYDGHREKAINHIGAAIRHLELPNAKGRSNAAVAEARAGKGAAKTAATPQDASDASLRKALSALFSVHHQLADHASTGGRIRADAEVRIAIQELGLALKTGTPAAAPAASKPGK
jgi:hypothetical protein